MHASSSTDTGALLQDALKPGETVLWSGRPRRIDRWRRLTALPDRGISWPAAVIAAVIGIAVALSFLPPLSWPMQACAIMLTGALYMIWRRACIVLRGAWYGSAILYAVTDRRIVFIDAGNLRSPQSIDIALLPDVSLSDAGDGLHTVIFGPPDRKALHLASGSVTGRDVIRLVRKGGTLPAQHARVEGFLDALRREKLVPDRKRYRPPRFEAIVHGPTVVRHVREAMSAAAASPSPPAG
jgi:hypothetical protein